MAVIDPANLFVRVYGDREYRFPVMLRHNGTVIAFAMDAENRILYTVLDYSAAGSTSEVDADHWLNNPRPLSFAREIATVGYGLADQFTMPRVRIGSRTPVPPGQEVRSDELDDKLSTTACLSAGTPYEVLSDGTFVYVFRQADTSVAVVDLPVAQGTLLVDRFVLSGTTLQPKLEVRYQRSRSRTHPAGTTDSLGAKDLNGVAFIEPTQNLSFVPSISEGRFAAALVPTQVAAVSRWQLFTVDAAGDVIWSYSIERTADGLFDTMGTQPLTCSDHPDVYSVSAGTCPRPAKDDETAVCSKPLVAAVPTGGASGTALAFPTDGSGAVTLDGVVAPGPDFTIEAWVRPDGAAKGERVLLGWSGDAASCGPSIWCTDRDSTGDGRSVRLRMPIGSELHDVTTPEILACDRWNHLAVTCAAGLLVFHVNGRQTYSTTDFGAAITAIAATSTTIGDATRGFAGLVDDLRIWKVALQTQDIETGRHSTLTGLEAGLVGYWRFDEGLGSTTWDSASAAKGTVNDRVSWTTSDAPIATAAGLSRSALRLGDLHVAGGLTAELYFQQENVSGGYAGSSAASAKRAARLALAVVTTRAPGSTAVSVLDFGVGVDGTLAQCRAEISLTTIDVPAERNARTIQAQLLTAQKTLVTANAKLAADSALLAPMNVALAFGVSARSGSAVVPAPDGYPELVQAAATVADSKRRLDVAAQNYRPYMVEMDYFRAHRSPTERLDPKAQAAFKASMDASTDFRNTLTALNAVIAPIQRSVDALNTAVTQEQADVVAAEAGVAAAQHLLDGGAALPMALLAVDSNGLTTSGATLGFASAVGTPVLFESALGRVSLYFANSDGEFLVGYYDTFTGRARVTLADDVGGPVVFTARSAAPEFDGVSVAVTPGDTDATCTLSVTLPGAIEVTETWSGLPRHAITLAKIVNAASSPMAIGTVAEPAPSGNTLALAAPVTMPVPAGALLQVGPAVLTTTQAVSKGATALPIATTDAEIVAGSLVMRIAYDYSSATSTRAGTDLSRGSALVRVDATSASGSIVSGSASPVSGRACQWSAPALGRAVDFDGAKTLLRPSAGVDNAAFDVSGDVTIESWVNPIGSGVGRIVTHGSGTSPYAVAVRSRRQALHYDGVAGHGVTLTSDADANTSTTITIEAWIRPDAVDGLRNIVGHGPTHYANAEVALRIADGRYTVGSWPYSRTGQAGDSSASAPVPDADWKGQADNPAWVHLAGVYDGTNWHLYRNGTQIATSASRQGAVPVGVPWTIGNSFDGTRPFKGDIEEVRIWNVARTAEQVGAGMGADVAGGEAGLIGAWFFDGDVVHDASTHRRDGVAKGLTPARGPRSDHTVLVCVGNRMVETLSAIPDGSWSHVAASFDQRYGVQFKQGGYLDAGSSPQLNLSADLTVEVGVRVDDLSAPHGLITRGVFDDGSDDDVPYALWVETDGRIAFGFEDKANSHHVFRSSTPAITPGSFTMLGVTRRHVVQMTTDPHDSAVALTVGSSWDEITFYVNGAALGAAQVYPAGSPGVGASNGSTVIGRAYGPNSTRMSLRGALAEVRLWNVARSATDIGAAINGRETGLVAYWRMQDGTGNVATDSKGNKHAVLHGSTSWVHTPDPNGSVLAVYLDGSPVATTTPRNALTNAQPQFMIGALGNGSPSELFQGQLQDVRVWRVTRTAEQVRDNLFTRLTGGFADLVAYYPLGDGLSVLDHGLHGNGLDVTTTDWVLSTAPLGTDIPMARNALLGAPTRFNATIKSSPVAAEYAMLETDANGTKVGALKRTYAFIDAASHWNLVTGFMVGDLRTDWIGQVQFDPQLMGFIEGAPPVPSENLTVEDSYSGTSSIALTEATSTTYTYSTSSDSGFDSAIQASAGWGEDEQAPQLGLIEIQAPLGVGIAELELCPPIVDVAVKGKAQTSFETSLSWLHDSTSGQGEVTTRSSAVQLIGSRETTPAHPLVGTRFLPDNKGFALVQSQTADVYALRLVHTGVLIAYQMSPNPDIPRDYNIITFKIDPQYVKQGTLDGKIGNETDLSYPNALTYSPDISYFKPIEAYALKTQIERARQELATQYEQASVDPNRLSDMKAPALPPSLTRDFVNTYVWTADGGQFAETTSTTDSYAETIGGSYHFQGMGGANITGDVKILGMDTSVELDAMFGGHLDLSISKTVESEKSFELDVTVTGEQVISVPDAKGEPALVPGKVDAYRWMTFYLSPQADNFDAFFKQVVDRGWLTESGDPGARALLEAEQGGKRPAAWRVLHRVTYVSRVLAALDTASDLDQALAALDIRSNYELIRTLQPFVLGHVGTYAEFVAAVRDAVSTYLPDLTAHLDDIVAFLVLYYGVHHAPQLSS